MKLIISDPAYYSKILEAHTADSKLYTKDKIVLGEGLDIYVEFYKDHKIDLSKWNNKN